MKESAIIALESLVKCVSRTYTLGDWTVTTRDYRVNCYGDDTQKYIRNRELWERLPRGLAFIDVYNGDTVGSHVVCGVRKFEYEETQLGVATTVETPIKYELYMTKENGECCHISCFRAQQRVAPLAQQQHFWIIGSKNVHAAVRNREDLLLLKEDRYLFCRQMGELFFDVYEKLTLIQQEGLQAWLCDLGYTLCAEACFVKSQHIVDYGGVNRLIFFAVTQYTSSEGSLTALYPGDALSLLNVFGLQTPHHTLVLRENNEAIRQKVFTAPNSEGAVVYALDDTGACRFIYKYKNSKYIIERAVREVLRRRGASRDIDNRFSNLHVAVEPELAVELKQFNAWLNATVREEDFEQVFCQWVSFRQQFAKIPLETRVQLLQDYDDACNHYAQIQLVMVGIVGSGKSTVGQAVAELLKGKYINQDALGGKLPRFQKEVRVATQDASVPVVVIDKCHHNHQTRDRTISAMKVAKLTFVEMFHPDDDTVPVKTAELSMQRIAVRGDHHDNLRPSNKLAKIIEGFLASWEPLLDRNNVIRLNILKTPKELVVDLLTGLSLAIPEEKEIEAALRLVATREKSKKSKEQILYLALDVGTLDDLKLPVEVPRYEKLDRHHITIAYFGGGDREAFSDIVAKYRAGEFIDVHVEGVAWDDKAVTLAVRKDFPCANEQPHITHSLTSGTQSVYSNTMLTGDHKFLAMEIDLKGLVIPMYSR